MNNDFSVHWVAEEEKPPVNIFGTSNQLVILLTSGAIVTGYWYNNHWEFDGLVGEKEKPLAWLQGLQHGFIKKS